MTMTMNRARERMNRAKRGGRESGRPPRHDAEAALDWDRRADCFFFGVKTKKCNISFLTKNKLEGGRKKPRVPPHAPQQTSRVCLQPCLHVLCLDLDLDLCLDLCGRLPIQRRTACHLLQRLLIKVTRRQRRGSAAATAAAGSIAITGTCVPGILLGARGRQVGSQALLTKRGGSQGSSSGRR